MKDKEIKVVTRKDEITYRTDDMQRAYGKYLAERVCKHWDEDFLDESTGEVVTIQRTEILFERGQMIDQDLVAKLRFSISAGEIKDILVSNQNRAARYNNSEFLLPFKVTATFFVGSRQTFLLQAQSASIAIEVAKDFIELNYEGIFAITKVEYLKECVILNQPLRKLTKSDMENFDANENIQADKDTDKEKESKATANYYSVTGVVIIGDIDEKGDEREYKFIIRTDDVDTGVDIAKAWLRAKYNTEQKLGTVRDIIVSSATPFPINAVIPTEFCQAYKEEITD